MAARVPRYLHLPVQILWFDMEDIAVILVGYLFWMIASTWYVLPVVVGLPYLFMQVKARNPRGFLKHLLVQYGFTKLAGYPPPNCGRFDE